MPQLASEAMSRGSDARGHARIHIQLGQSRQKAGFIPQHRRRVVVWMPSLPVGKYHHSWPLLPQHAHHFQPVLPGVLDPPVGNVERLPPRRAQYFRRICRFARAIFGAAPRSHLALGQIEDSGAMAALRHLEQRAAAGLLYVVAVGSQGKNIERTR